MCFVKTNSHWPWLGERLIVIDYDRVNGCFLSDELESGKQSNASIPRSDATMLTNTNTQKNTQA